MDALHEWLAAKLLLVMAAASAGLHSVHHFRCYNGRWLAGQPNPGDGRVPSATSRAVGSAQLSWSTWLRG